MRADLRLGVSFLALLVPMAGAWAQSDEGATPFVSLNHYPTTLCSTTAAVAKGELVKSGTTVIGLYKALGSGTPSACPTFTTPSTLTVGGIIWAYLEPLSSSSVPVVSNSDTATNFHMPHCIDEVDQAPGTCLMLEAGLAAPTSSDIEPAGSVFCAATGLCYASQGGGTWDALARTGTGDDVASVGGATPGSTGAVATSCSGGVTCSAATHTLNVTGPMPSSSTSGDVATYNGAGLLLDAGVPLASLLTAVPAASATALGGVKSLTCAAGQAFVSLGAGTGVFACSSFATSTGVTSVTAGTGLAVSGTASAPVVGLASSAATACTTGQYAYSFAGGVWTCQQVASSQVSGLGNAAAKGVSNNSDASLASVSGVYVINDLLAAADVAGSLSDTGIAKSGVVTGSCGTWTPTAGPVPLGDFTPTSISMTGTYCTTSIGGTTHLSYFNVLIDETATWSTASGNIKVSLPVAVPSGYVGGIPCSEMDSTNGSTHITWTTSSTMFMLVPQAGTSNALIQFFKSASASPLASVTVTSLGSSGNTFTLQCGSLY